MAVSRNTGRGRKSTFPYTFAATLSRYDLLLAAIPLVLGLALLVGAVVPVPFHLSVGVGAGITGVLVADALYVHPPTAPSGSSRRTRGD